MKRIARLVRLPRSMARIRADIDEEIRFDVDMRARDLVREGMSADAAHAQATREFGDLDATKRYCEEFDMQIESESRRAHVFEDLRSDLLIAFRGMRRAPVFAAVVLVTLALGVGANTAIFSVVRPVLIAPLPFRAPEELYRLYTSPSLSGDHDKLSAVELTDLAAQSQSVAGVTFFGNYMGATYSDDRTAETWQSVSVAPNFFSVLGVQPVLGRGFGAEDFVRGAPSVLMISYQVWQRLFGGDRAIVGRDVQLGDQLFAVVGVLPEHFVGPTFNADVLLPLNVDAVLRNPRYARSRVWRAVARLEPGVSLDQWRGELGVLRPRLQTSYPEIKNAGVFLPTPLHEAIVGGAGPVLRLVMGGALLVLLATCVNIAGLFLSRAVARRRELGVRTALGAGRGRLVRQMLAEALLYGIAGGTVGALLAVVFKAALLQIAGPMLPQLGEVRVDTGVLAFALTASVLSGIVFGVIPALVATRVDVRDALGEGGGRAVSRGTTSSRASRALVSAQVAFAMVLVIGAALFVRTFRTLVRADLGYATTNRHATFFLGLGGRYQDAAAQGAFVESFLRRVGALPNVSDAGYTVTGPWLGPWRSIRFQIDGRESEGTERPTASLATASSRFFAAAGMTIRAGRGFDESDRLGTAPVVVINESMARRFWAGASPIGARIRLGQITSDPNDTTVFREIVGVVKDTRENAMIDPIPTVYVSAEQSRLYGSAFVVRTAGDAGTLLTQIKEVLHSMDPKVPLTRPRPHGRRVVGSRAAPERCDDSHWAVHGNRGVAVRQLAARRCDGA